MSTRLGTLALERSLRLGSAAAVTLPALSACAVGSAGSGRHPRQRPPRRQRRPWRLLLRWRRSSLRRRPRRRRERRHRAMCRRPRRAARRRCPRPRRRRRRKARRRARHPRTAPPARRCCPPVFRFAERTSSTTSPSRRRRRLRAHRAAAAAACGRGGRCPGGRSGYLAQLDPRQGCEESEGRGSGTRGGRAGGRARSRACRHHRFRRFPRSGNEAHRRGLAAAAVRSGLPQKPLVLSVDRRKLQSAPEYNSNKPRVLMPPAAPDASDTGQTQK